MKYEKCVKMGKERDRPVLHRKTGTISIANLFRRKMLSPSMKSLAAFKSCIDHSNPTSSKHVRWATPIERVHLISVPTVDESTLQQEVKPTSKLMNIAAKSLNFTPYYCFDCQQYYSSQSKLNRHKGTQKHQQQVINDKFKHIELESPIAIKQDVPDDEIKIVTKPIDMTAFYCYECQQQYSSQKKLNRHKKTIKHTDNVHIQLRKLQN